MQPHHFLAISPLRRTTHLLSARLRPVAHTCIVWARQQANRSAAKTHYRARCASGAVAPRRITFPRTRGPGTCGVAARRQHGLFGIGDVYAVLPFISSKHRLLAYRHRLSAYIIVTLISCCRLSHIQLSALFCYDSYHPHTAFHSQICGL